MVDKVELAERPTQETVVAVVHVDELHIVCKGCVDDVKSTWPKFMPKSRRSPLIEHGPFSGCK